MVLPFLPPHLQPINFIDQKVRTVSDATTDHQSQSRLANFPITFFAIGMGMMGLTLSLRAAETTFAATHAVSMAVLVLSVVMLAAVAGAYLAKALRYPDKVVEDWHHPVKIAFFPAISISLLLLATALVDVAPGVAEPLWLFATALQGVLALAVISAWIGHRPFQTGMMTPAWFIPAVGNVIVPLAGSHFGLYRSVVAVLFGRADVLGGAADVGHEPPDVPRSDAGQNGADADDPGRTARSRLHCLAAP